MSKTLTQIARLFIVAEFYCRTAYIVRIIASAQILLLFFLAVVFYWCCGQEAAWFALAGGFCYLIPSAVAMLLLKFFRTSARYAAVSFLWGESLKVILCMLLMLALFLIVPQVQWLPFLIGLFAVSHIVFLVIWKLQHGK